MKKRSFSFMLGLSMVLLFTGCGQTGNQVDKPETETASTLPQREFRFWVVGNDGYKQRFGTNSQIVLRDIQANTPEFTALLLALDKGPYTMQELKESLQVPDAWLEQTIRLLTTFRFLSISTQDTYYINLPVLTDEEMKSLQQDLMTIAEKVARVIDSGITEVRKIYEREKTPSDPEWMEIVHLVIDKFLIDGTFHGEVVRLEKERGIKKYYSDNQKQIPAFFIEARSEYATFGTNWYGFSEGPDSRHVFVLHGGPFKRFEIPFNAYRGDPKMETLLKKIDIHGSLEALTPEELSLLKEMDWVRDEDRLAFPVTNGALLGSFRGEVQRIGNEAAEVVFDEFATILNVWEKSAEREYADGAGDYIQVCYHLLFPCIIRELTKIGTLPAIPDKVPEHFGVYMTIGSFWD